MKTFFWKTLVIGNDILTRKKKRNFENLYIHICCGSGTVTSAWIVSGRLNRLDTNNMIPGEGIDRINVSLLLSIPEEI
jgi:hypothetical protein